MYNRGAFVRERESSNPRERKERRVEDTKSQHHTSTALLVVWFSDHDEESGLTTKAELKDRAEGAESELGGTIRARD